MDWGLIEFQEGEYYDQRYIVAFAGKGTYLF